MCNSPVSQESDTANYERTVGRQNEYLGIIITASKSSTDSGMLHANVSVLSLHKTPILTLHGCDA